MFTKHFPCYVTDVSLTQHYKPEESGIMGPDRNNSSALFRYQGVTLMLTYNSLYTDWTAKHKLNIIGDTFYKVHEKYIKQELRWSP